MKELPEQTDGLEELELRNESKQSQLFIVALLFRVTSRGASSSAQLRQFSANITEAFWRTAWGIKEYSPMINHIDHTDSTSVSC